MEDIAKNLIFGEATLANENAFGERVDPATGSLSFRVVDVSLPGQGPEMIVARSLDLSRNANPYQRGLFNQRLVDWDLDIPRITTTGLAHPSTNGVLNTQPLRASMWSVNGAASQSRCSNFGPPRWQGTWQTTYYSTWWGGVHLELPSGESHAVLKRLPGDTDLPPGATAGDYPLITTSNWIISCLPNTKNGIAGEAFLATSPDGTKYWFDWFVVEVYPRPGLVFEASLYPTRVEDRFGNYVTYTWSGRLLTDMQGSDGRKIRIDYESRGYDLYRVTSVRTNPDLPSVRQWTYQYESASLYATLSAVVLPDGSRWQYAMAGLSHMCSTVLGEEYDNAVVCDVDNPDSSGTGAEYSGTATAPSGLMGTFRARNLVRPGIRPPPCAFTYAFPGQCAVSVQVLREKEYTGPGMSPRLWSHRYCATRQVDFGQNCPDFADGPATVMAVWSPDGTLDLYYSAAMGEGGVKVPGSAPLGRPLKIYRDVVLNVAPVYQGPGLAHVLSFYSPVSLVSAKRIVSHEYQLEGAGFAQRRGIAIQIEDPINGGMRDPLEKIYPLKSTTILVDGDSFSRTVQVFDARGRALSVVKASSLGFAKTEVTEYHDDTTLWVLGQVKRQYDATTGMIVSETQYDAKAQPWKIYRFGKLQQTLTYDAQGMLATATDGRNHATTVSDWKRGVPREIRHPPTAESPLGAIASAMVDDNGWVTSVTDEAGHTTGYAYDGMGRVTGVAHPANDTVPWAAQSREFRPLTGADWLPPGVSIGQWRQYEGEANRAKFTYYDAMWQPVLVQEYDTGNVASTVRYTRSAYDSNGRTRFQSYPGSDPAALDTGTRTFHDALDRVVRMEQDSESDVLATTNEYLVGLRIRATNPRNLKTITSFMAWDEPNYDLPVSSLQPEGKVVEVLRHPQLGWPQRLTQRSTDYTIQASRWYVYDGHAQLCKTIEPETGATVTGYDGAGNLAWSASGLTGGDYALTSDCSFAAANASGRVVNRAYDTRNRLTQLTFPDGLGDQAWTYTPDSLPASITAYNTASSTNGGTPVVTAYTYNKRRLLIGESVTQPGWYSWGIGYEYSPIGHLRWQSYPTGLTVDYAPNALGQATEVRNANQPAVSYASGAQYYPNGAMKQFTYGNGIVHSMSQNARQLPARVTSTGNVLDFAYDYDKNGNPTTILDLVTGTPSAQHRWMSYDGLDRLTTSASAMYGGSDHTHRFTYDALDNIESWKHAGVKDYADYVYDSQNRLISIRNTAGATVLGIGYDPQGNLANKNGQLYDFDYGNRLRIVQGKESYRYDGLGRRVQTTKTDGSQTTLWQYGQAGQMLFSTDWDGPNYLNQKTHEYLYLAGSLIATIDHDWPSNAVIATKYQHTDALGSPVAVTNQAGAVIERNNYEPYGAIIGNPTRSGIGYTGHVMDAATGLTYMQQRYYDPSIGRFLSVDSVGANAATGGNFNRYWYADNRPYVFKDPDGRIAETVWDVANLAIGGASLAKNIAIGNYIGAAVDGVGLIVDGVATAVPVVPGGAGTAIKAYRLSHVSTEGLAAARASKDLLMRALAAAKSNVGNFNIGRMARGQMDELGQTWVGKGARPMGKNGSMGWVSADGLKTYRFPQLKKNGQAAGQTQGNLTEYFRAEDGALKVLRNAHVDLMK